MDDLHQKYIYDILILKKFLKETFGEHCAYEIVQVIIIMVYPKIFVGTGCNYNYLLIDNDAYLWGANAHGQLGLGHNEDQNLPQMLTLSEPKIPFRDSEIAGETNNSRTEQSGK